MLKGKLKYILVGIGVLIVGLSIMRYTPLAFGSYNNHRGNSAYSRPFNEGFMRGPRGYHGGCMGYFYDDYESHDEFNK